MVINTNLKFEMLQPSFRKSQNPKTKDVAPQWHIRPFPNGLDLAAQGLDRQG